MGHKAVIFIQRGPTAAQQTTACLGFAAQEGISVSSIARYWAPQEAVRLVREGACHMILAAFDSRVVRELAAELGPAGEVWVIHPEPGRVEAPTPYLPGVRALIRRWAARGRSVEEIARDVEGDTRDIRAILRNG